MSRKLQLDIMNAINTGNIRLLWDLLLADTRKVLLETQFTPSYLLECAVGSEHLNSVAGVLELRNKGYKIPIHKTDTGAFMNSALQRAWCLPSPEILNAILDGWRVPYEEPPEVAHLLEVCISDSTYEIRGSKDELRTVVTNYILSGFTQDTARKFVRACPEFLEVATRFGAERVLKRLALLGAKLISVSKRDMRILEIAITQFNTRNHKTCAVLKFLLRQDHAEASLIHHGKEAQALVRLALQSPTSEPYKLLKEDMNVNPGLTPRQCLLEALRSKSEEVAVYIVVSEPIDLDTKHNPVRREDEPVGAAPSPDYVSIMEIANRAGCPSAAHAIAQTADRHKREWEHMRRAWKDASESAPSGGAGTGGGGSGRAPGRE